MILARSPDHFANSLNGANRTIRPQSKTLAILRSVSMFGRVFPGVNSAEMLGWRI